MKKHLSFCLAFSLLTSAGSGSLWAGDAGSRRVRDLEPIYTEELLEGVTLEKVPDFSSSLLGLVRGADGSSNDLIRFSGDQFDDRTTVASGEIFSLTGGYRFGSGHLIGFIDGLQPVVSEMGAEGTILNSTTLSPNANYWELDVAVDQVNGLQWAAAYNANTFQPEVWVADGTGLDFSEVPLNLGDTEYLGIIFGGIRNRIICTEDGDSVLFASTTGGEFEAIQIDGETLEATVSTVGSFTLPPQFESQYAAESIDFHLSNYLGFGYSNQGLVNALLFNPKSGESMTESVGAAATQLNALSAAQVGWSRVALAWSNHIVGLNLSETNGEACLQKFGKLEPNLTGPVVMAHGRHFPGDWIFGNHDGQASYASLDLNNNQFAAQAVPGISRFVISNWESSPLSLQVRFNWQDGAIAEEKQIDLGAMETVEFEPEIEDVQPASVSFKAPGSYGVAGVWTLGASDVAVLPGERSRTFTTPVEQQDRVIQAIAIANPNGVANECIGRLYDPLGTHLGTFDRVFQPYEQSSQFLNEWFDDASGLNDGVFSFTLQCQYGVAMTSGRQDLDTQTFTNFPARAEDEDPWKVPYVRAPLSF